MRPTSSTAKLLPRSRSSSFLGFSRFKTWSPTRTYCSNTHNSSKHTSVLTTLQFRRTTLESSLGSHQRPSEARHYSNPPSMDFPVGKTSLEDRLKLFACSMETKIDAINGRKVPLALGSPEIQACLIRGIRHHDGFGTELQGIPKFDRALNARAIMSNRIPAIDGEDRIPYCIWYPEVATEETYRQLAQKYPQMRYHVGRACAVAGYVALYRELELLPDVAIAEEARDNEKNGSSIIIFNEIMAAPAKFAVMNDYTRTVNTDTPLSGVCLNADTAVRSSLNWRRDCPWGNNREEEIYSDDSSDDVVPDEESGFPTGEIDSYWNITEDWKFDNEETQEDGEPSLDLRIPLFYSPLPRDLPNINKDMLICQAAYSGNIDRYIRLRRPVQIEHLEWGCILRGIHYNTMFAKWWSLQPEIIRQEPSFCHPHSDIIRAINARYIMNNNLTRITEDISWDHLPYLIYWPNVADKKIYAELFRRQPDMKIQIARACIVADYQDLYETLNVQPDFHLAWEARESSNPFYAKDQKEKADAQKYEHDGFESWKQHTVAELMRSKLGHSFNIEKIPVGLGRFPMCWGQDGIWEGFQTDMTIIESEVGRSMQPLYRD